MGRKTKIFLGVFAGLVVLSALAAVVVITHLEEIVKTGILTEGPRMTKTTLTVDRVHLSIFAGSAGVDGLLIGNPEGYQAPESISVSNIAVSLAPNSVLSEKIVIHSLELKAPEVTFEGNPLGANNLAQLIANMSGGTGPESQAAPSSAPPAQGKPGKKFEVDDLIISNAKVHAHLSGLINKDITLPVPDIHITGLGQGAEGITGVDLGRKILSELTTASVKTLVTAVASAGRETLKSAQDAAKVLLSNATNGVGAGVDRLKKGMGGLLGK